MELFKNLWVSFICLFFVLTTSTVKPGVSWPDELKALQGLQLDGKNVFQGIDGATDLSGVLNSDWSALNSDLIAVGGVLTQAGQKDKKNKNLLSDLNKAIGKDANLKKDAKAIGKFFDAAIKAHDGKVAAVAATWADKLNVLKTWQLDNKNVFQNIGGATDLLGVLNSGWSTLNPDLMGVGGVLTQAGQKDKKNKGLLAALNKSIEKDNNFTKADAKQMSKFFDAAIKTHDGKVTEVAATWADKLNVLKTLQLDSKTVFQNIDGATDLAGVLQDDWSTVNPDLMGPGGALTAKQSKDSKKQLEVLNSEIKKNTNLVNDAKAIAKFFDAAIKAHDGKAPVVVANWAEILDVLKGLQLDRKTVFLNIDGATDLAGVLKTDWSTLNPDLMGVNGVLTGKQTKEGAKQLEILNKEIKKNTALVSDSGAIADFFKKAIKAHDGKTSVVPAVAVAPKTNPVTNPPQASSTLQAKLTTLKQKLAALQASMVKLQTNLVALKTKLVARRGPA